MSFNALVSAVIKHEEKKRKRVLSRPSEDSTSVAPLRYHLVYTPSVLWFMTRFESRDAHGCGEQWNARDMRIYTSSSLREDKNPTSCIHQLYYDCFSRDPLYPSFCGIGGGVYIEDPVSYGST
jgi:hypothetical protein